MPFFTATDCTPSNPRSPPRLMEPSPLPVLEVPDVDALERRVGAVEPPGLVGHDLGPGLAGTPSPADIAG